MYNKGRRDNVYKRLVFNMKKNRLSDVLLWIIFLITLPFMLVYHAGVELGKKAVIIVLGFFAFFVGLFFITDAFLAVVGDWQTAIKNAAGYVSDIWHYTFIEWQDLPNKMNVVISYIKTHPFVRNLLIMWLIGFLIQQFFGLLGRYSYSAYAYRVRKMSSNQQNEPPQEVDPTDGFTKARFDAYFPEGWQERRQNFFNQVREAKEEIQKRLKKK